MESLCAQGWQAGRGSLTSHFRGCVLRGTDGLNLFALHTVHICQLAQMS